MTRHGQFQSEVEAAQLRPSERLVPKKAADIFGAFAMATSPGGQRASTSIRAFAKPLLDSPQRKTSRPSLSNPPRGSAASIQSP